MANTFKSGMTIRSTGAREFRAAANLLPQVYGPDCDAYKE